MELPKARFPTLCDAANSGRQSRNFQRVEESPW
jgi:hypothetical protein